MKLDKKKALAMSTLGIGKDRVVFNTQRLDEIKEAITKQDIRDLVVSGAIIIRDIKGRRTVVKRTTRRRAGSVKMKVNHGKKIYMIITRKLRAYAKELLDQEKITKEKYLKLRQQIKAHAFKSKAHFKEHLAVAEVK
ncbi:MAG: 50S ribosomal protein L19e [Nanoarchaeota archaeon]